MKLKSYGKLAMVFLVLVALFSAIAPASAEDKVVTLKYATMNAPTSWHHTEFYVKWAEKVNQVTQGRVVVKIFPAQTLGKATSFFDMVQTGMADIALGVNAYNPGQFPLTEMMSLPMMPVPSASAATATLWELFEKYPAMQKEYEGTKFLHFGNTSASMLINNKRPITKLEDIKGMQIRVTGTQPSEAITILGGVPVGISISELYVALEKGVVDGVSTVWEAFSQIPVDKLKYITEAPLFTNAFWVAANPRSWEKISPQDQETIWRECCGLAGSLMEGNVFDLAEKPAREMTKHWEYTRLSPEELERWRTLIHPIHDKYIAALEKRGLPAKQFYDDLLGMLQKNAKYTPVIK